MSPLPHRAGHAVPSQRLGWVPGYPQLLTLQAESLCQSLLGHVQQNLDERAEDIGYGLNSAWLILCGECACCVWVCCVGVLCRACSITSSPYPRGTCTAAPLPTPHHGAGALVFLMHGGFAMLCAGAIRSKNTLNILLQVGAVSGCALNCCSCAEVRRQECCTSHAHCLCVYSILASSYLHSLTLSPSSSSSPSPSPSPPLPSHRPSLMRA